MTKDNIKGLSITGRLKESGITLYTRNGRTIVRTASSKQPKRRTRKQFIARQQLLHSCRLWDAMKWAGEPLFPARPTAYSRFISLMRRTSVVFFPNSGSLSRSTLLLPDMPVSEGLMPTVKQHLGVVDGNAALVTNLFPSDLHRGENLVLFTLQQAIEQDRPKLRISQRKVSISELTETDDGLALIGEEFDDDMKGWALVRTGKGNRCSSQTVVTRCTYYLQYTTEKALQEAAKSYGGLTKDIV